MKKWKVRFTLFGIRQQTAIDAPSQSLAIAMIKALYPTATGIAANEIR